MWSHHEKMVVIDHSISYMGGLDLCFGRYDIGSYPLFEPNLDKNEVYFPG